jgi:hypothetical protein
MILKIFLSQAIDELIKRKEQYHDAINIKSPSTHQDIKVTTIMRSRERMNHSTAKAPTASNKVIRLSLVFPFIRTNGGRYGSNHYPFVKFSGFPNKILASFPYASK